MGAGSIVSTISDMVKWDAALNGKNFLKPTSRAEWWKQYTFTNGKPSPYGFGWRISDIRGHKLIGHTGQTAGFGAANFRYVDDGVTAIVLTNLGEIGLGGQIAARIAKFYAPGLSLKAITGKPEPDRGPGRKASGRSACQKRRKTRHRPAYTAASPLTFDGTCKGKLSTHRRIR